MNVEVGAVRTDERRFATAHDPVARERVRLRLQLAMLVFDVVAITAAMLIVGAIRLHELFNPQSLTLVIALAPIYVAVAINGNAYGSDVLRHPARGIVRALVALFVALAAVMFIAFYLQAGANLSRIMFASGSLCAALLIIVSRRLIHAWSRRPGTPALWNEIIISDGVAPFVPKGFRSFDAASLRLVPTINDPMMLDRLGNFLRYVDRVVVACTPDKRERWASALKGANVHGEVLVPELTQLGALGIGRCGGCATMLMSTGSLGLRNRLIKRAMDLSLAAFALLLLAPLLGLVAIAVRIDSPGPVLFVQKRLGRGNRLFGMYKFRSMRFDMCDPEGKQSTRRDDERVTRVGRLIRATSIDELPQLFNILFGDMSFVGPRPHALGSTAGNRLFWEVDERYWHRHAIKPGLTGLAQIRGFRGATHATVDLSNRLQADLEYLAGWTIWRDFSILFGTFKVLIHRNAF